MSDTLVIPTVPGAPDYTMRTRLDGKDYNLRFLWNQRTSRWTMDIADVDGNQLQAGILIVANWPLLRYYHWNADLPPGEFIAHDLVNFYADPPGFNDMAPGKRVELTYYPATNF